MPSNGQYATRPSVKLANAIIGINIIVIMSFFICSFLSVKLLLYFRPVEMNAQDKAFTCYNISKFIPNMFYSI